MRLSDKYPFLTNYFTQALSAKNRALPQSLLFYGNDLEAQYTLAQEIARFLNCKENKKDDCECLNCRWINEGTHPAVMTISRLDNKPEDDSSKTVISVKQSQMIKEMLVSASNFHRVFIFCDRNDEGNISELNRLNFQDDAANSLLKLIEEPQPNITFIFLTRYIEDVLPTILSRSQCFFVPALNIDNNYDFSVIQGIFTDYYTFERKDVFEISDKLQKLVKDHSCEKILDGIQNYILQVLKQNPKQTYLIQHAKYVEDAKRQNKLGMKPVNIFDELCLKLIN